jgi:hypothetical protein
LAEQRLPGIRRKTKVIEHSICSGLLAARQMSDGVSPDMARIVAPEFK